MYQALLADVRFHQLLLNFDHDMADTARSQGCACGGVLHSARYRRKPRGLPARCRHRDTPPSLRFLGRRVYLATMVVLISAMRHGATAPRVARLSQLIGVSRRTVAHWREWWRTTFAQSRFWQAARAAFMPPVDQDRLPASLLERFAGGGAEQLLALLRFLAPITGGAVHAS